MNTNEWGLAEKPAHGLGQAAATSTFPTTQTAVGGGLGAVAGGLVGALVKHPVAGLLLGAAAGAGGGYYYGTKQAPATTTPVSSGAPPSTPTSSGGSTPSTPSSGGTQTAPPQQTNPPPPKQANPSSFLHNTPSEVAPGPYTLVPAAGSWGISLQPNESYLISISAPANVGVTETQVVSEVATLGLTVLGSWGKGAAPSDWPSTDPNAAAGIFVAVSNDTGKVVTIGTGSGATVWATAGKTS